jgi:SAM domain (Sterile alpha motif)
VRLSDAFVKKYVFPLKQRLVCSQNAHLLFLNRYALRETEMAASHALDSGVDDGDGAVVAACASPAAQKQVKRTRIKEELFSGSQGRPEPGAREMGAVVRDFLAGCGLGEYSDRIVDDTGFDELQDLRELSVEDMASDLPFLKAGHRRKLLRCLREEATYGQLAEPGSRSPSCAAGVVEGGGGGVRFVSAKGEKKKEIKRQVVELEPDDAARCGPPELASSSSDEELLEEYPFEQQQQQQEDVVRHGNEEQDEESWDSLSVDAFWRLLPRERIGHRVSIWWAADDKVFRGMVASVNEKQFPGEIVVSYDDGDVQCEDAGSLVGVEDSSAEQLAERRHQARELRADAKFLEQLDAAKKNELFDPVKKEELRGAGAVVCDKKRPANFSADKPDGDFKKAKLEKKSDAAGPPPKPASSLGQLTRQYKGVKPYGVHSVVGANMQLAFCKSIRPRSPINGAQMWFINHVLGNGWCLWNGYDSADSSILSMIGTPTTTRHQLRGSGGVGVKWLTDAARFRALGNGDDNRQARLNLLIDEKKAQQYTFYRDEGDVVTVPQRNRDSGRCTTRNTWRYIGVWDAYDAVLITDGAEKDRLCNNSTVKERLGNRNWPDLVKISYKRTSAPDVNGALEKALLSCQQKIWDQVWRR